MMFTLLIENGAKVNVKNDRGHTPLTRCVLEGDESMTRMLIDNGADVNLPGVLFLENSNKELLPDVIRGIGKHSLKARAVQNFSRWATAPCYGVWL